MYIYNGNQNRSFLTITYCKHLVHFKVNKTKKIKSICTAGHV
jgi:hypothetical protein